MILWTTFGTRLAYLDYYIQWHISKNGGNPHLCNWALCETWFCQTHEGSAIFLAAEDINKASRLCHYFQETLVCWLLQAFKRMPPQIYLPLCFKIESKSQKYGPLVQREHKLPKKYKRCKLSGGIKYHFKVTKH